ncbi:MAG: STAS domain-containing protein [Candidatus Eremiobacteraeota bacterium]|nr:STAS domain-containing protein [Candidatus Eremiobacteraeota bacterium]
MRSIERRILSGDIDLASREALEAAFEAIPDCDELLIDMLAVRYVDSTGLSSLIELRRRLRSQCGASVKIAVGDPGVYRVFRVCGLDKIFELDLIEAAAAS